MKKSIIILLIFASVSAVCIYFSNNIYEFVRNRFVKVDTKNEYLMGSAEGEHGVLSLKLKLDYSGAIKEIFVTEHPDNEIANVALQKLINNSLDKQNSSEIDAVSGATETSTLYKNIVGSLIDSTNYVETIDNTDKWSLKDPEVLARVERAATNTDGLKCGLGGYTFNQFQDADYNKNGNLYTNEYICAVTLNQYNRIEDIKFDHISSNISFDKQGKVPTGGAKEYIFPSDKSKPGFNGIVADGDFVNMFDFEKQCLTLRHFTDIRRVYGNRKGYAPFIHALENAIDNSRFIGASNTDTLGLAAYKSLKKRDIIDSTSDENGNVKFASYYCLTTVDKEGKISSAMFDNVKNNVTLTEAGKVLGSREKEVYTLNELCNFEKYSKVEASSCDLKYQLNTLAEFMRGNTIDNLLKIINDCTDDKGYAKEGTAFAPFYSIDFIDFVDLISRSFIEAIKIRV